eukprot:CAMPEP_0115832146 /NCGR_PEP_ID=MMETSP0287-20121206/2506_1 /TAXON_ID=412157 /ORGANISM="Chrysochromulina rotalis, Strain UIO044" /LENGTH=131 /DNA_ID=CAMNT_0003285519 /DNA_START=971 /DNA_END=1366 /DNA_ORIENTATION=-
MEWLKPLISEPFARMPQAQHELAHVVFRTCPVPLGRPAVAKSRMVAGRVITVYCWVKMECAQIQVSAHSALQRLADKVHMPPTFFDATIIECLPNKRLSAGRQALCLPSEQLVRTKLLGAQRTSCELASLN